MLGPVAGQSWDHCSSVDLPSRLGPRNRYQSSAPADVAAEFVAAAANAAKFPDIATFALQPIRQGAPDNLQNLHQLAIHYMGQGNPGEARKVYADIVKQDSSDMVAVKGEKDAAAQESMNNHDMENEYVVFRDRLRHKGEAEKLQKRELKGMTPEQLEERKDDLFKEYDERSQELPYARELAEVHEKLEDLDGAVQWYEWALSLSQGDTALEKKLVLLKQRQSVMAIKALGEKVASATDPGEKQELQEQLNALKAESAAKDIQEAQARVDANPTDKQYRFELGQALVSAARHKEAIPHLQQAKSNPSLAPRAKLLLGQCFMSNNMNDMSAGVLKEAIDEMQSMDDLKKELLYDYAGVLEKMEKKDEALDALKEIYNADYEYRDVAQRVESSYE